MSRSSPSRQLRKFKGTLPQEAVPALAVIRDEHFPGQPITTDMVPGMLISGLMVWAELIKEKQKKERNEQIKVGSEGRAGTSEASGEEDTVDSRDEERRRQAAAGTDTDASVEASGDGTEGGGAEV